MGDAPKALQGLLRLNQVPSVAPKFAFPRGSMYSLPEDSGLNKPIPLQPESLKKWGGISVYGSWPKVLLTTYITAHIILGSPL